METKIEHNSTFQNHLNLCQKNYASVRNGIKLTKEFMEGGKLKHDSKRMPLVCKRMLFNCCWRILVLFPSILRRSLLFPSFDVKVNLLWINIIKSLAQHGAERIESSFSQFVFLLRTNQDGNRLQHSINQNYLVYVRIIHNSLAGSRCKIERLSDGFFCHPPVACSL